MVRFTLHFSFELRYVIYSFTTVLKTLREDIFVRTWVSFRRLVLRKECQDPAHVIDLIDSFLELGRSIFHDFAKGFDFENRFCELLCESSNADRTCCDAQGFGHFWGAGGHVSDVGIIEAQGKRDRKQS